MSVHRVVAVNVDPGSYEPLAMLWIVGPYGIQMDVGFPAAEWPYSRPDAGSASFRSLQEMFCNNSCEDLGVPSEEPSQG